MAAATNWWRRFSARDLQKSTAAKAASSASYVYSIGTPVWTPRRYDRMAEEAYMRNVVAFRSVSMIAEAAASVNWRVMNGENSAVEHPALGLIKNPNPVFDASSLIESMVSHRLISGNAYLLATGDKMPLELHLLRPDSVQVIAGDSMMPKAYRYNHSKGYTDIAVDRITGASRMLHWKKFHPLDAWYGMSPVEAAAYSIDQHNQAGEWNQALLQNGARPSGALVVKGEGSSGFLSENQYQRLREQVDSQFSGASNAGRPLLLEGGLDWKEMSISPKDMDFLNTKHSAARDIALAFGVPPQLLGIPGDNTYSNLQEARLALWEQTILPLLDSLGRSLTRWLLPMYGNSTLRFDYDRDAISALTSRRDAYWARINAATFLSDEEKKKLLGGYF